MAIEPGDKTDEPIRDSAAGRIGIICLMHDSLLLVHGFKKAALTSP